MGLLAAGQVVVLPFPFSDLSRNKDWLVLLLVDACRGGWIACQTTSNLYSDSCAIALIEEDFEDGGLAHASYVRPGKLFTPDDLLFVLKNSEVEMLVSQSVIPSKGLLGGASPFTFCKQEGQLNYTGFAGEQAWH